MDFIKQKKKWLGSNAILCPLCHTLFSSLLLDLFISSENPFCLIPFLCPMLWLLALTILKSLSSLFFACNCDIQHLKMKYLWLASLFMYIWHWRVLLLNYSSCHFCSSVQVVEFKGWRKVFFWTEESSDKSVNDNVVIFFTKICGGRCNT